jgi:hypothetical protein
VEEQELAIGWENGCVEGIREQVHLISILDVRYPVSQSMSHFPDVRIVSFILLQVNTDVGRDIYCVML